MKGLLAGTTAAGPVRPPLASDFSPVGADGQLLEHVDVALLAWWRRLDASRTSIISSRECLPGPPSPGHASALVSLSGVFGTGSRFWNRSSKYEALYFDGARRQLEFSTGATPWSSYTSLTALELAAAGDAPLRAVAAALAELGWESEYERLAAAIRDYALAVSYFGSVCDWRGQLERAEPSLLLQGLEFLGESVYLADNGMSVESIGRVLHYDGHITNCLEQALRYLEPAIAGMKRYCAQPWHASLLQVQHRIASAASDLKRLTTKNRVAARFTPPDLTSLLNPRSEWARTANTGIKHLVHYCMLGFGELRHFMRVNSIDDPHKDELYSCDVFQRAVVTDIMCDVSDRLNGLLDPLITREIDYLIAGRLKDGIGGWSYCPTMAALPPDADDLGQVMQVLARTGNHVLIERYAGRALNVLFDECSYDDGSFDTWIIPANGDEQTRIRQKRRIRDAGRAGPTPEVIANLLFGLSLYGSTRYLPRIELGLTALEGMQRQDGAWTSEWYVGDLYGTYVCVRALAELRPSSHCLNRAVTFVLHRQNKDGSWAAHYNGQGDALNTAFGLLTLSEGCTSPEVQPEVVNSVGAAIRYLRRSQTLTGWPSCDWLTVPYGSQTITTAYVTKAAIAWEHALRGLGDAPHDPI